MIRNLPTQQERQLSLSSKVSLRRSKLNPINRHF